MYFKSMQSDRFYKSYRGFTLVELLVVIAIIALLLSVLMPALSKVRFQAKTTICKSNMHQWGLANMTYAGEYNGRLPMVPTPEVGLNLFDTASQLIRYSADDYKAGTTQPFTMEYKDTVSGEKRPCIMKSYGINNKKLLYCPHTKAQVVINLKYYMDSMYADMTLFVGYNWWVKRPTTNPATAPFPAGYLSTTFDKGASTLPILTDVIFKGAGRLDKLDSSGEKGRLETNFDLVMRGQLYLEYGTHIIKNKVGEADILYGDNHVGYHLRKDITTYYKAYYKNLY